MRDQDSVAVRSALHDAVVRAMDEAGIREPVLRGMCLEVALERFDDSLKSIQSQQDGAQGGEAVLYAAAEKGFHISETCGPDGKYWHVSKFQSLADLQAYEHAWRDTMLAAKNQRLSRPAIAPQGEAADLLRKLIAQDTASADECEAMAARLGEKHETHNELLRDASQYRTSVYRYGLILAALTPNATPAAVDDAMFQRAVAAYRDVFDGCNTRALHAALTAALAAPPVEVKP